MDEDTKVNPDRLVEDIKRGLTRWLEKNCPNGFKPSGETADDSFWDLV